MLNAPESACPECGDAVFLDPARAEVVCSGCSVVVADRLIELVPPLRTDDDGVRQEYHAGPTSLPFASLMTYIRVGRDATGKALTSKQTYEGFRLARVQRREASRLGRGQRELAREVYRLASRLQVSRDALLRADGLLAKLHGEWRGQPFSVAASVLLLLADRSLGGSLRPHDFAAALGKGRAMENRVARAYRIWNRRLGLGILPASPIQFIPRLCSNLGVPFAVERGAMELVRVNPLPAGSSPVVWAAGAVYAAAKRLGVFLAQKRLAEVSSVSEVSVRKASRALRADESLTSADADEVARR